MDTGRQISIPLPEISDSLYFDDAKSFDEFIDDTREAYSWLKDAELHGSHPLASFRHELFSGLAKCQAVLRDHPDRIEQAVVLFGQAIRHGGIPLRNSNKYEFLLGLQDSHGAKIACSALAAIAKDTSVFANQEIFQGLILSLNHAEGVTSRTPASVHKSLKNQTQRLDQLLGNAARKTREAEEASRQSLEHERFEMVRLRRSIVRHARESLRKRRAEVSASIERLEQTRTTYKELMSLKAPVDYWREKSATHKKEAEKYRGLMLHWGKYVVGAVLGSLLVIAALSFAFAQADKPAPAYLILVTIGVVITTMAFWVARLVIRLYLSEHHLSIDAEERAVMVMTYLALLEKGAASEAERALILAPLFRPSSDGIVKDDAAPEFSPAALLSRALNKP